ncbi:MAG: RNA methyltransferase [Candidatus Elarobacter sp.]
METGLVPTALSPKNPRFALALELTAPSGRRAQARFAAEGATMLEEARRSGVRPVEVYVSDALDGGAEAVAAYEADGVPVFTVPDSAFGRLSGVAHWWGMAAVFSVPATSLRDVLQRPGPVLLLAGVNDPGNAGTLIRSAEAFGAAGVLFGRGGAEPYGQKVVRASMGSIFRLPVVEVDADDVLAEAKASGRTIVAADVEGDDLREAGVPADAIVAVGNERRGVRDWLPRWDRAVRIPQRTATESLNAAVAGSIVLYESGRVK